MRKYLFLTLLLAVLSFGPCVASWCGDKLYRADWLPRKQKMDMLLEQQNQLRLQQLREWIADEPWRIVPMPW